jgi:signal transduction histidine kinase/CheY-like chemotaxis protein
MTGAGGETLLVLAPTGRDAELAVDVLGRAGLEARACRGVDALCAGIAGGAAGVLVAEEALTATALARMAAVIRAQPPWSDLPVVVFSSRPAAIDGGAPAAEPLGALGNVTLVDRPLRRRTLVSVAQAALRARRRQYAARDVLVQLQAAVRQRDEFLALLGHELRNPLAAIEAAGQLLERGAAPERPLGVLRRQTRQLARLVDDLLDVARVTSGKVTLRPAPVDLRLLAQRCVETHAEAARAEHGVELSFSAGEAPVFTVGDAVRLEQVLANLVSNALKYTPRGGHVRVTAARERGVAVLRVADDGIGIPADDLARVFEPFVQVSAAIDRARGGMGLGLTLVRSLVEGHGGTVEARSAGPGRGSEFTVRLAAAEPPAGAAAAVERAPARRDVLVVEDNDDVREPFAEALALAGHDVRSAPAGEAALELARARRPDVAFVDIGLPDIDGYEVARRLRAEHGSGIYLVALTGYGRPDDRARTRDAGFDLHLTKPADLDRADAIVRSAPGAGRARADVSPVG